jgi:hypothetical protein
MFALLEWCMSMPLEQLKDQDRATLLRNNFKVLLSISIKLFYLILKFEFVLANFPHSIYIQAERVNRIRAYPFIS